MVTNPGARMAAVGECGGGGRERNGAGVDAVHVHGDAVGGVDPGDSGDGEFSELYGSDECGFPGAHGYDHDRGADVHDHAGGYDVPLHGDARID